jgi:hypothetical protein
MTGPDYSDDEIQRLLQRIREAQQFAPTPKPSKPEAPSKSGTDVSRELSIDEILKKIERGIAGER